MANGAIAQARIKKAEFDALKNEAEQLGVTLTGMATNDKIMELIKRIKTNPKLARAIDLAKENGVVLLCTATDQAVGAGYVQIAIARTDAKIIKFLLGE